ncbi:MAG TPA: hypothetical protein PLL10_01580 [Elusimicrobiales bacterium]|nr:hypothetical protein [Elusimicrobiales bacterium]
MKLDLGKAFKIPKRQLKPEELKLLRSFASAINRRGLQLPATIVLDGSRPLHFLGGSACRLLQPILESAVFKPGSMEKIARLLENPAAADHLLELLSKRS